MAAPGTARGVKTRTFGTARQDRARWRMFAGVMRVDIGKP
jgi:hypothetical protein